MTDGPGVRVRVGATDAQWVRVSQNLTVVDAALGGEAKEAWRASA